MVISCYGPQMCHQTIWSHFVRRLIATIDHCILFYFFCILNHKLKNRKQFLKIGPFDDCKNHYIYWDSASRVPLLAIGLSDLEFCHEIFVITILIIENLIDKIMGSWIKAVELRPHVRTRKHTCINDNTVNLITWNPSNNFIYRTRAIITRSRLQTADCRNKNWRFSLFIT